jgi:RNA polymerase-binding transcription factor DksA
MYPVIDIDVDMAKYCKGCGNEIHPLRIKVLPNTQTCVNCSQTGRKSGVPVLRGDIKKDDTWVDVVFIDENE